MLTAIRWQALFPDLRDYRALGTLPVRTWQLFGAKLAALSLIAAATLLTLNLLPRAGFPAISGGRWAASSFAARCAAHLAASLAGCAFLFFALVGLQGVLLNMLRPSTFGRVTAFLQGSLVAAMLVVTVVSFSIQPQITLKLTEPQYARWLPPIWFLGLYQKLLGAADAPMSALSHLATLALVTSIMLAMLTYLVSYTRHRTLLLEGMPRRAKASRFADLLPRLLFSTPRQQAVADFIWRTISRSSRHRTIIMGYAGLSLAIILTGFAGIDQVVRPERVMLADFVDYHVFTLVFLFIGTRHLFSIPVELKANWIFQITEREGRAEWLDAVDRLVLLWGLVLILGLPLALEIRLIGARAVLETALMAAVGLFAYQRSFFAWTKLPFTCSRFVGQTPAGLILAFAIVFSILLVACALTHKRRRQGWAELSLKYDDLPEPAIQALNLLK